MANCLLDYIAALLLLLLLPLPGARALDAWLVRVGGGACAVVYWTPIAGTVDIAPSGGPWTTLDATLGKHVVPSASAATQWLRHGGEEQSLHETIADALADPSLIPFPGCPIISGTLSAAITAAASGAVVAAAPTTWRGVGNCGISWAGKSVTLIGVGGAAHTIIDCEGATGPAVQFTSGETADAVIDGFTLTRAASGAGDGGALRVAPGGLGQASSPTLSNLIIESSSAPGVGGGVSVSGGEAALTNVTIRANSALGGGGGLAVGGLAEVRLRDVVIENNAAEGSAEGGGVRVERATVAATRLTIANNSAAAGGGLVLLMPPLFWETTEASVPASTLAGCRVASNTARDAGGGLLVRGRASLLAERLTLESNRAATTGGGAHLEQSTVASSKQAVGAPLLDLDSSTLALNSAAAGGALFAYGAAVHVHGTSALVDNAASASDLLSACTEVAAGAGGAAYAKLSLLNLTGATLARNTAATAGGAAYADGTRGELPGLAHRGLAQGLLLTRVTAEGNRAMAGGALLVRGGSATLDACELTANHATHSGGGLKCTGDGARVEVLGGVVSAHEASFGAGLMAGGLDGTCTLHATSLTCNANRALLDPTHRHGGACAAVEAGSQMTLVSSNVIGNEADELGGGLVTSGTLNVTGGILRAGRAQRGAGIVVVGGEASLSRATLTNNTAGSYGGGAFVVSGRLSITDCELTGNTASTYGGGAIAVTPSAAGDGGLQVTGSVLRGNTAVFGAVVAVAAQTAIDFEAAVPSCTASPASATPSPASNLCTLNRARGWGDAFGTLPAALVLEPSQSAAARSVGLGEALTGSVRLRDALGVAAAAPATITFEHASLPGSGADASAMDAGTGCSSAHCLLGARLVSLPANESAVPLAGLALSGSVGGSRLLRASASGFGWSVSADVVGLALVGCGAGYGRDVASYAVDTTVANASAEARQICVPCATGEYSAGSTDGSLSACVACPEGKYAPSRGTSACLSCPAGTSTRGVTGASACQSCPAGTSTDGLQGAIQCSLCALGSYSSEDGSTVCSPCPAGSVAPDMGRTNCDPCSRDAAAVYSASGQPRFVVCADGADCEGKSSMLVNRSWWFCLEGGDCAQLEQAAASSSLAVLLGDAPPGGDGANATATVGGCSFKGAASGWWAPPGTLSQHDPLAGAAACTLPGVDGGPPLRGALVQSGAGLSKCEPHTTGNATRFFECNPVRGMRRERCLGPEARAGIESACAEGNFGPICAACLPGYYRAQSITGAYCKLCDAGSGALSEARPGFFARLRVPLLALLVSLSVIVAALVVPTMRARRQAAQGAADTADAAVATGPATLSSLSEVVAAAARQSEREAALEKHAQKAIKRQKLAKSATSAGRAFASARESIPSLVEPVKQAFAHLQIVSLTPEVVSARWPPALSSIASSLVAWVAVDLELPSVVCAAPQTIGERVALSLAFALVLLLAPPLTYALVRLRARRGAHSAAWAPALQLLYERSFTAYLIVFLVVYAPVSSLGLRYFACRWYGDGWYNRYDVSLMCYDADGHATDAFLSGIPAAALTVALITLGLPIANFLVLYVHRRRRLLQTHSCRRAFGMLYVQYTPEAWWWDSVEVGKKVVFTSALALVDGEPAFQCAVGLVVALAILLLQSHVRPFREAKDGLVCMTAHVATFSLNLVGLEVEAGYTAPLGVTLCLTLLPLWAVGLVTCVYIPAKVVAPKLRKKKPALVAWLEQLPEKLQSCFRLALLRLETLLVTRASAAVQRKLSQRSRRRAPSEAKPDATTHRNGAEHSDADVTAEELGARMKRGLEQTAAAIKLQAMARGKAGRRRAFLRRQEVAESREELFASVDRDALKDRPERAVRPSVSSEEARAINARIAQRRKARRETEAARLDA